MRWNQLPQPTAARLLDLEERVSNLVSHADAAEATMLRQRGIINDKVEVKQPGEYESARATFNTVYAEAKASKQQADIARGILQACRSFVEQLPANSKLALVNGGGGGVDADLPALQGKLRGLRDELRILVGSPPVSGDIARRVESYVAGLAAEAVPMVKGFHAGGVLDVQWASSSTVNRNNGDGFDDGGNAVLMTAALNPAGLAELIMAAVKAAQPLSQAAHAERRRTLEHAIDALSYETAAALEVPSDVAMEPRHWLGVRLAKNGEREEGRGNGHGGKAAAIHV